MLDLLATGELRRITEAVHDQLEPIKQKKPDTKICLVTIDHLTFA